ncbi:uncharacterized protein OCT59_012515 [Rhizophagus irregularis]|uniref:uncharacterized protein n=1 Tax=Rhizophagus irregularis TaxID=588596 RepID=UPI003323C7CD|nr:hypothetical protein OCT59_012515 [Rhizophagus irregularis]
MKVYSTEVSLIAIFNSLVNLLPLNFLRLTILKVSSLDFEGRVSVFFLRFIRSQGDQFLESPWMWIFVRMKDLLSILITICHNHETNLSMNIGETL